MTPSPPKAIPQPHVQYHNQPSAPQMSVQYHNQQVKNQVNQILLMKFPVQMFSGFSNVTINYNFHCIEKTKAQINCLVTAQLIWAFVFCHILIEKSRFFLNQTWSEKTSFLSTKLTWCKNIFLDVTKGIAVFKVLIWGGIIVGYMGGNLVLRLYTSGAVKCDFRTKIQQYTSLNENFEYGYPHSNALLQSRLKLEHCKPYKAANKMWPNKWRQTVSDSISQDILSSISQYTVAIFLHYPIRPCITKASALERHFVVHVKRK